MNTDTQRIDWLIAMSKKPEGERCLLCTSVSGFVVIMDVPLIEDHPDTFDIPKVVGSFNPDLRVCIDEAMARVSP